MTITLLDLGGVARMLDALEASVAAPRTGWRVELPVVWVELACCSAQART